MCEVYLFLKQQFTIQELGYDVVSKNKEQGDLEKIIVLLYLFTGRYYFLILNIFNCCVTQLFSFFGFKFAWFS